MAALRPQEKHHYIAPEKLRDKYIGYFDRVKSLTKAIESGRRTAITVELKRNGTIEFIIIGGRSGVDRTLEDVKYEFEKGQGAPPVRLSRAKKAFLSEGDQKKLQHEGRICLLTADALRRHDILTGATELRQFACLRCNHPWWKHVSRTKPVSTCNRCHVRYDALDRDKEFGIGRYICESCEHTFYVWCEATSMQECYGCNSLTGPPFISPRFKPVRNFRNFTAVTAGPRPPPRIILYASTPHLSTGSTISSSAITEDLGSDIYVSLETLYAPDDFPKAPPGIHFEQGNSVEIAESLVNNLELLERPVEARLDIAGSDYLSGEVSELEVESAARLASAGSSDAFDAESESGAVSRERTQASDSDSDGTSEVDVSAPEPGQDEWPCVGDSG